MPETRDIKNIRARLERWELSHLRTLAAALHNQLEAAKKRADEAEMWASTHWRDVETLREELLQLASDTGASVGLTQQGEIVVTKPGQPPAPGQHWPEQGGTYIGIASAEGGLPMRHLVVLDAKPTGQLTWAKAMQWAESLGDGAHAPTQLEAMFAWTTCPSAFEKAWHWTSTQGSRNSAVVQDFEYGDSSWYGKVNEYRVRAVRGLALENFTPLPAQPVRADFLENTGGAA